MEMKCPISSVTIPGLSAPLELTGLIVIVGPNSAGKTQLLQDINEVVLGRKRKLVVLSAIQFNKAPDFEQYFEMLIQNRAIREKPENQYQKRGFQFGAEEGGGEFYKNQASHNCGLYSSAAAGKELAGLIPSHPFLEQFGPFSASALFLKNRLNLMDSCGGFDARSNAPTKTLQALSRNADAQEKLRAEIVSTFKRGIWIDPIGHYNHLVVRVSDKSAIPTPEDRLDPEKMETYRGIETEGDGIRSYAAICSTLLLERRPLCIIDEPEMCLHPPQAQAIGRFIGKHVSSQTCTIVATHSSHVLRGILECKPSAHVVRLSRDGSAFRGRLLTPEALTEATSKPRSRSEAILEGIFAQGVALCEGDGDRVVYESTYQTLKTRHLDIRFISSEGTGGFADPLRLYNALGVPSVVIADLDYLGKDGEIRSALIALGVEKTTVDALCRKVNTTMQKVRSAADCLDLIAVQNDLKTLSETAIDEEKNDRETLRGKIGKIHDRMNRLHELKQTGIISIPESWTPKGTPEEPGTPIELRQEVETLVDELKALGLFLVPVGELESWLPTLMKGIDRRDKSKWAMLAAEKIEEAGERQNDVWGFIAEVAQSLVGRLRLEHGNLTDDAESPSNASSKHQP